MCKKWVMKKLWERENEQTTANGEEQSSYSKSDGEVNTSNILQRYIVTLILIYIYYLLF